MLSDHFNLTHFPFTDDGDLRGLFESPVFEETYDELLHGVLDGRRMQLVVGPAGSGRTTMLTRIRTGLQSTDLHVVSISHPNWNLEEFLTLLNAQLAELPSPFVPDLAYGEIAHEGGIREELMLRLAALRDAGFPVVLLVDDAEDLGSPILNQLTELLARPSHLTGAADATPEVLAQVVLAVEPDFAQRLTGIELDTLNAAIDGIHQLSAWDRTTVTDYVCAAVEAASGVPGDVFTEDALEAVYRHSEGVPARVNALCGAAMREAKVDGKRKVTAEHVELGRRTDGGLEPAVTEEPFAFPVESELRTGIGRRRMRRAVPVGRWLAGAAGLAARAGAKARERARGAGAWVAAGGRTRIIGAAAGGVVAVVLAVLLLRPGGEPTRAPDPASSVTSDRWSGSAAVRLAAPAGAEPASVAAPGLTPERPSETMAETVDALSRTVVSLEARVRSLESELGGLKRTLGEMRDEPRPVVASADAAPSPAGASIGTPNEAPTGTPAGDRAEPAPVRTRAATEPPPARPAPTRAATPRVQPMASTKSGVYQVEPGDTLWSIAQSKGVSVATLSDLNGLPKDAILKPGQTLQITQSAAPHWYTVRRGDSLYSIGKRFAVAPARLADWNCLANSARIYPGQRINVAEPAEADCDANRG